MDELWRFGVISDLIPTFRTLSKNKFKLLKAEQESVYFYPGSTYCTELERYYVTSERFLPVEVAKFTQE